MAIRLKCPKCGTIVKPGNRPAGAVASCPNCRSPMRVPEIKWKGETDTDPAAKAVTVDEVETVDTTPRFSDFIPSDPRVRKAIGVILAATCLGLFGGWIYRNVRIKLPVITIDRDQLAVIGQAVSYGALALALIYIVCVWPVQYATKISRKLGPTRKPVGYAVVGAVSWGIIAVLAAIPISQYIPVFGDFVDKAMAQPWSPARLSGVTIHMFVFGLLGILFGALGGAISGMIATPQPAPEGSIRIDTQDAPH